jgi:hypothetical protein
MERHKGLLRSLERIPENAQDALDHDLSLLIDVAPNDHLNGMLWHMLLSVVNETLKNFLGIKGEKLTDYDSFLLALKNVSGHIITEMEGAPARGEGMEN